MGNGNNGNGCNGYCLCSVTAVNEIIPSAAMLLMNNKAVVSYAGAGIESDYNGSTSTITFAYYGDRKEEIRMGLLNLKIKDSDIHLNGKKK